MQFAKFTARYIAASFFASVFSGALIAAGASAETSIDPQVVPGVGNFHKVDDHVYRGAQPTDEGFRNLAKLGIQTVIDLREPGERSTAEEETVKAAGMRYVKIPMKGMEKPSDESIRKALDLLEDRTTGPLFVHCMRGADRTGDVIACYRIEQDHWKNAAALAEARSLGMSWFQKSIQHYVLSYHPRILETATSVVAGEVAAAAAAPVAAIVH